MTLGSFSGGLLPGGIAKVNAQSLGCGDGGLEREMRHVNCRAGGEGKTVQEWDCDEGLARASFSPATAASSSTASTSRVSSSLLMLLEICERPVGRWVSSECVALAKRFICIASSRFNEHISGNTNALNYFNHAHSRQ